MKMLGVVLVIVLVGLATIGCATDRMVYVQPECSIPPMPAPPEVTALDLDPLSDDVYWRVLRRDRELTDSLLEHRAVLREVCQPAAMYNAAP